MWNPKDDKELQQAIHNYARRHNLILDLNIEYKPVIDGVYLYVSNHVVLRVGLPPVSNYNIRETEYTDKYLRAKELVAV